MMSLNYHPSNGPIRFRLTLTRHYQRTKEALFTFILLSFALQSAVFIVLCVFRASKILTYFRYRVNLVPIYHCKSNVTYRLGQVKCLLSSLDSSAPGVVWGIDMLMTTWRHPAQCGFIFVMNHWGSMIKAHRTKTQHNRVYVYRDIHIVFSVLYYCDMTLSQEF